MSEENGARGQSFDLDVKTLPGSIVSNIGKLKEFIEKATEPYIGQVVTEDQLKFAKKDLAALRKVKEALESERKRAKAIIMAPYDEFEAMYKEAIASLSSAINGIDAQVKEIEAQAKEERRKAIVEMIRKEAREGFGESFLAHVDKPEVIGWLFDPKWLNASASDNAVRLALRERLLQIHRDLDCIAKMPNEGAGSAAAVEEYYRTGSLSAALDRKRRVDETVARLAAEERARKEAETEQTPAVQDVPSQHQSIDDVKEKASEIGMEINETITVKVPPKPEGLAGESMIRLPAILVFPKYKMEMIREIMTKAGIRILRPSGLQEAE